MQAKHFVIGIYSDEQAAHQAVEAVIESGCPMDRVSVLGRLLAEGDDVLGVVHPGIGKRMEVWGGQGAFWGGVAGLLAGTTGVFWFPVLGPVMAVGHLVSAFAGAAAGTAIGGVGLAGAAAVSQIAVALQRYGLPESTLDALHQKVEDGRFLLIIQAGTAGERDDYQQVIDQSKADEVLILP
jgi:hypothetical protein